MEDNFGNLKEETYPSGFTIENMYNQRGFLTQVNNKQTSQPIWELLDVNSKGQPLELSLGNGLHSYHEYDPYGFLYRIGTLTYPSYTYDVQDYLYHFIPEWGRPEQRFNLKGNDEHYYYDEDGSKLNRLSRVTVATHPAENLSMQYFSNGNISSKTGLGTYAYEDPQHLHAVTKVDNTAPLIPETRQDITYTPFNKVSSIIEGENELFFTYGTSNQRVKTEYYNNDFQKTKYFLGNYEQEIIDENIRELHYIAGPMGLAAIYVKKGGNDTMYYTHTDHLGSITEITNNTGTLLQRMQYDAWGKRSFITNNIGINNFLFDRGYTGHEHLDQFALINMNGRLYDPVLGRMLSPDNFAQNSTQGLNRYSYAMNNPMVYTDPDGELVWFIPVIIGAVVGAEIGGAWTSGCKEWNPLNWNSKEWKGAGVGAIIGAGVGLGVSAGLAAGGANITGIYTGSAGATSFSWGVTYNALMTANINMASSALQGRDLEGVATSGLVGLGAGAIGGAIGSGFFDNRIYTPLSQEGIKATNYITSGLNGFGDRYFLSLDKGYSQKQAFNNGLIGAGEGLYLSHFWGNKVSGLGSWNVTGRYLSGAITQAATSIPGLGLSVASWHAAGYVAYQSFANGMFPELFGNNLNWYSPFVGIGGTLSMFGYGIPYFTRKYMKENYPAVIYPY